MSRFWAAGGSSESGGDSSDESSGGGGSSSDSDDNNNNNALGAGGAGGGDQNRWLAMSDDSSDDDDGVRVVLSGQQRFQEAVQASIVRLKKAMKQKDYYAVQTEFDDMAKNMIKNKQYLSQGVPRPLVRILVDLEDFIALQHQDKGQFKTLSARQGRALNRMKLTLKKHNKAYQTVMKAYRLNPVVSESDNEDDNDDKGGDNDDDKSSGSSSSSSSSGSGSSSSSSSDSDSDKDKDDDSVRFLAVLLMLMLLLW